VGREGGEEVCAWGRMDSIPDGEHPRIAKGRKLIARGGEESFRREIREERGESERIAFI